MRRNAINISPFALNLVTNYCSLKSYIKQWRECSIQPNICKSVLVSIIICGNSGLSLKLMLREYPKEECYKDHLLGLVKASSQFLRLHLLFLKTKQ